MQTDRESALRSASQDEGTWVPGMENYGNLCEVRTQLNIN